MIKCQAHTPACASLNSTVKRHLIRALEKHRRTALRIASGSRVLKENPARPVGSGYYFPYVCFSCCKSFKRAAEPSLPNKKCPDCGGVTVGLSRNFKAPPKRSHTEWKVVEYLVSHGIKYFPVYDKTTRHRIHDPYPRAMRAAQKFVRGYVARDA